METNNSQIWTTQDTNLIFSIGGKEFIRVPLRLNATNMSYATNMEPAEQVVEPTARLKEGTDGCVVDSYAVLQYQPTIKMLDHTIQYANRHYKRYCIDLSGTFDEYIQKFKSKTRKRIRNRINKFTRFCDGKLIFKSYQTAEDFDEFYQLALSVSVETYQHKLHQCGLPDNQSDIEIYRQLAVNNALRGFLLFHGDKPIAYNLITIKNNVALADAGGYNPEYANWSVGTVTEWLSLEKLFADDTLTTLDYGLGEADYKEFFSTGNQLVVDVFFLKKTLRNTLLIISHAAFSRLIRNTGNLIDKVGLKKRLIKLIRRSA